MAWEGTIEDAARVLRSSRDIRSQEFYLYFLDTADEALPVESPLERWTWNTEGDLTGLGATTTQTLQCRDSFGNELQSTSPGGGVRRVRIYCTGGITMTDGGAGSVVSGSGTSEAVFDTDDTGTLAITFAVPSPTTRGQAYVRRESALGPTAESDVLATKRFTRA